MKRERLLGAVVALGVWLSLPALELQAQPRSRSDAGVSAVRTPRRTRSRRTTTPAPRPPTHGTLPIAETRTALHAHNDEVRRCYQTELAHDPTLRGEVEVRLRVESDGRVSESSVGGEPSMLRVGRCIERVLRRVTYPLPEGGPATLTAPYRFAAGD